MAIISEKMQKLQAAQEKALADRQKAMEKQNRLKKEIARQHDRERTHRLCNRGGRLETYLLEPESLTDDDVFMLLDYIFSKTYFRQLVSDMLAIRNGEKEGTIEELFGNRGRS